MFSPTVAYAHKKKVLFAVTLIAVKWEKATFRASRVNSFRGEVGFLDQHTKKKSEAKTLLFLNLHQ